MLKRVCASLTGAISLTSVPAPAQDICTSVSLQGRVAISITLALSRYKTVALKKDEFETTAAYQARVAASQAALSTSELLIALPEPNLTTFNADTGEVTVPKYSLSTTCLTNEYSLSPEMKAVVIGKPASYVGSAYCMTRSIGISSESSYQATNAYGATVTVEKTHSTENGIFFGMGSYGKELFEGEPGNYSTPAFSFPATPDEARSLKANGQLLVLLKPVPPFAGEGSYYGKPTFDQPAEMFIKTRFLVGHPLCVAIGDRATGKVFSAKPTSREMSGLE